MEFNPVDAQSTVVTLSQQLKEPEWFLNHRLLALEKTRMLQQPVIERIDYSEWNLWKVPKIAMQDNSINIKRKDGVQLLDFASAFNECGELFEKLFKRSSFTQLDDLFNAFTLAFLTQGIFIYVPDNLKLTEPIELDFLQANKRNPIVHQQVLVYVGNHSSVEISEKYFSDGDNEESIHVHVDLIAEAGSSIHYSSLDQFSQQTTAFIRRTGSTAKDSMINIALGAMSDGQVIEDIQINLNGEGSSSDVKSVAVSHGSQVQMINVGITNIAPNTVGNIFQHGVVLEKATLSFNGIGHILKDSKQSNAQQESRVLMLSDEARADANPILLIDEFEVQAGHAASVTRVDQEQLYYLMSRGLDKNQAEKLVILGFLGLVLEEISVQSVRKQLVDRIERKLTHYEN